MKLDAKISKQSSARRDQLISERARAAQLRQAFPQIEQLRIELTFSDARGRAHSPQVHTLYPAARAFFRFACTCNDCDGDYDLGSAVATLLKSTARGTRVARGSLVCDGARRDLPADGSTCSIRIDYQLTSMAARTTSA
jgi:hypothetical protein